MSQIDGFGNFGFVYGIGLEEILNLEDEEDTCRRISHLVLFSLIFASLLLVVLSNDSTSPDDPGLR